MSKSSLSELLYRTGGTSLARRYNHRLSSDLDFFSEQLLHNDDILVFLSELQKTLHPLHIESQVVRNRRLYIIDGMKLEITFFPFPGIQPKDKRNDLMYVDSIEDIATNKIHAISERREIKDVIDMMYIITNEGYEFDYLISNVHQKFGVDLQKRDIIARMQDIVATDLGIIEPYLLDTRDPERIKNFVYELI